MGGFSEVWALDHLDEQIAKPNKAFPHSSPLYVCIHRSRQLEAPEETNPSYLEACPEVVLPGYLVAGWEGADLGSQTGLLLLLNRQFLLPVKK
jgi:hypothetical protein